MKYLKLYESFEPIPGLSLKNDRMFISFLDSLEYDVPINWDIRYEFADNDGPHSVFNDWDEQLLLVVRSDKDWYDGLYGDVADSKELPLYATLKGGVITVQTLRNKNNDIVVDSVSVKDAKHLQEFITYYLGEWEVEV